MSPLISSAASATYFKGSRNSSNELYTSLISPEVFLGWKVEYLHLRTLQLLLVEYRILYCVWLQRGYRWRYQDLLLRRWSDWRNWILQLHLLLYRSQDQVNQLQIMLSLKYNKVLGIPWAALAAPTLTITVSDRSSSTICSICYIISFV